MLFRSPAEYVKSINHGKGADLALEAAGVSAAVEGCLFAAATFGKVVLMGNPAKNMDISQKAWWEILRKQLVLMGTWNSSYNGFHNDWQLVIECMENGILDLSKIITHKFNFNECNKAFRLAFEKNEFWVKIMFVNKEKE